MEESCHGDPGKPEGHGTAEGVCAHLEGPRDVGGGGDIWHNEQFRGHGPVVLAHVALGALGHDVHRVAEGVAHHVDHRHLRAARAEARVRVVEDKVRALMPLPPRRSYERLRSALRVPFSR